MLLKAMSYAGLRLGEALAMRAEFFDPAHRSYFVCQSYKNKAFNKPKGGRSRLVDLPEFLVTDLESYLGHLRKERLRTGGAGRVDLLFGDPAEDDVWPFSQRKVQALFARVCRAARLRVRNPHDARHTYATLLLMAHRSPAYVQHQLGHSSISITIDVYGHWIPGQGREGLEEALSGGAVCTESVPKPHIFRI
jgi:integrase